MKATTEVEDLVDWLLYSDLQESACLKYELDTGAIKDYFKVVGTSGTWLGSKGSCRHSPGRTC